MENLNGISTSYSIVPTVLLEKYLPGFKSAIRNISPVNYPSQRNYSNLFFIIFTIFIFISPLLFSTFKLAPSKLGVKSIIEDLDLPKEEIIEENNIFLAKFINKVKLINGKVSVKDKLKKDSKIFLERISPWTENTGMLLEVTDRTEKGFVIKSMNIDEDNNKFLENKDSGEIEYIIIN